MAEPIIHARGVNFAFGFGELRKQILQNVSFDILPGEVVLLTGPSGSGKTTLLTLSAALRTMQEGTLRVLGCDLSAASASQKTQFRRRVGFIFQTHNLMPCLSARENVAMALELHPEIPFGQRDRLAREILGRVGLAAKVDSIPERLSVGQRQRVAVARALVGQPELMLADEPTASLDSQSGREVVELLRGMARERGCPILLVTHDTRVLDVADRVIRMEDGRIVEGA
jgi:putative ABC transport system ATP-binding protein